MTETTKPTRSTSRVISIAIAILLIAILPFVPWLSHGFAQSSAAKAIKAVGGRVTYNSYLSPTGDYHTGDKSADNAWKRKLLGSAFVDQITCVTIGKQLKTKSVIRKISKLPELQTLNVSGINFDDADAAQLAVCTKLQRLDLQGTQITGVGLQAFAELPDLVSLNLDETLIDNDAIDAILAHSNLKRLYLAKTSITDEGVAKLISMTSLLGLGLEGTKVTNTALAYISKLPELQELRLSNTSVTDEGLSQITKNQQLDLLHLNHTNVSTLGLDWLKDMPSVSSLELRGTQIDDGIVDILVAMPKLLGVDLRDTNVSADAVADLRRRSRRLIIHHE
jgi:hypothetical protein